MKSRQLIRTFSSYKQLPLAIPASEFLERRFRLLNLLNESAVAKALGQKDVFALLLSRPKTWSAPNVPNVYRQCSNFLYFCGINQANFRLLIGPKESVLFMESQTEHQIIWDGAAKTEKELIRISGIDCVLPVSEFQEYLIKTVRDGYLAVDLPSLFDTGHMESDLKKVYQMLADGGWQHISLNDKVDQLRWRKSEKERELMRESARIGSEVLNAMFREIRLVGYESHIVGFLEHQSRWRGANYLAYPPVVASGSNANTIHYISSDEAIKQNDCVLVDAGCDVQGYVSDITRCFPVSGSFSTTQKTLYDVLHHVQVQLLHYVQNTRPLRLNELYCLMVEKMAEALNSIVFFRKDLSDEDLIKECDKLCPHHVSHYLGMDVHDTPSISRAIECKPGVVITVEPGIYVRPDNMAVREEFKGIGFRIEDDVLLTDTGAEILTQQCIRSAEEIEFAMRP